MDFVGIIIQWYKKNHRKLPWRETRDPYKIWLSEVILQQTRVDQGLSYFYKFIEKYPTIKHLANAKEEEVLKLWQGLGYYSRARNLLSTSIQILKNHNGKFPESYKEILNLKGIGPYTAAAISSFAYDLPHPVIDGNVYRVLSRYFGCSSPIDSTEGKKYFSELAHELLPEKNVAIYNQAIMEFGAMQCTPVNPDCNNCPLKNSCEALRQNNVKSLPVKEKKTQIQSKWFYYFVIEHNGFYYLKKREENSIWKNLYDFPLLESDKKLQKKSVIAEIEKNNGWKNFEYSFTEKKYTHLLSHRKIEAEFILVKPDNKFKPGPHLKKNKWGEKPELAVPRLVDKFLDDFFKVDNDL